MKRRWDFYEPPPYYMPPMNYPPNPVMSLQQAMEAKEWWEKIEKTLKKDKENGNSKKGVMQQGMNMASVLLLLIGTSPFVALIYKFMIIPALLR